jgi:hypothetical protein
MALALIVERNCPEDIKDDVLLRRRHDSANPCEWVLKYSLRECYRMLSMIVGQEERQY